MRVRRVETKKVYDLRKPAEEQFKSLAMELTDMLNRKDAERDGRIDIYYRNIREKMHNTEGYNPYFEIIETRPSLCPTQQIPEQ